MVKNDAQPFPCPSCGYLVFEEPPGSYDICPICCWEDDAVQLRFPNLAIGANKVSLVEAQRNFCELGAKEARFRNDVRSPAPEEVRDPDWRLVDLRIDRFESASHVQSGLDYFHSAGDTDRVGSVSLYYWRKS